MSKIVLACFLLLGSTVARAQSSVPFDRTSIPVAVRFSAIRANAPPGSCGCFWLQGAAADAALPLPHRFSAAVEVASATVDRVPGTARGLSEISLLAGPRYTQRLGRTAISGQALFGAAHGFDSDFASKINTSTSATAFGMALGGFVEASLTRAIAIRVVQVDFLQTRLPNGVDNRQQNLRIGAGIVFRVALPSAR